MFRLRLLVSHLVLLSCLPLSPSAGAQTPLPEAGQPTEELPPIDGATAASGTPYFTENPEDQFKAYDTSATVDWMPSRYITWRIEYNYRAASVPYFSGPGSVTPEGGNTGAPGSVVPGWAPDLRRSKQRTTEAILVKF